MKCPQCQGNTKTLESRTLVSGKKRRRRECTNCGFRFTTYEILESKQLPDVIFDSSRHYLGSLCDKKHEYIDGKSIRYISNRACVICTKESLKKIYRIKKKKAQVRASKKKALLNKIKNKINKQNV